LVTDDQHTAQLRSWLAAVARRDATAFRSLYDAASPKLFGFALRILNKRELAEEALQESFVNIWNNAASYQAGLAAPMTWMTTIVRNKAFDLLRRLDDAVEIDADTFDKDVVAALESTDATPIEALQMSGDAKALARCLSRLEGLHRQAIALAFYHDLSHSEVAEQMKQPLGTIKTWIRRGLERLRNCLSALEGA
jgi:RNA polymerase sigma-70 factor (ECF subfamily)